MTTPYRVAIDASNQPTAAQNYEHGATALTGFLSPAAAGGLTDGQRVVLLAEQVDANGAPAGAFEFVEATWNDDTTDFFVRDKLLRSSSGSLIDWSAAGVNVVPRLRVMAALEGSPVELVATGEITAPTSGIVIGGTPAFDPGWDYELVLRSIRISATAAIIALFWDPDAGDWDASSLFGVTGYGGVAASAIGVNNWTTGYALLQAPTTHVTGQDLDLRMVLRDPAHPTSELMGDLNVSWYTSNHCRSLLSLLGNTAKDYTGVGFALTTGSFTAGRYYAIRRRIPA